MSIPMALTRGLLRLIPTSTASAESMRAALPRRRPPAPVSAGLRRIAVVTETRVRGRRMIRLTPKIDASGAHLLYTHGGAYVNAIRAPHWGILAVLLRQSGVTVTVPYYGLAPEHAVDEAYDLLDAVYDELAAEGRVFLAGDSAGGGLALGMAERIRDTGRPAPAAVLLFSPWLDATMGNPDVPALERRDPMLAAAGLVEAGQWWAGERDPRDPLVSPLFGDLADLPPVYTYQGDRDVFAADATVLAGALDAAGGHAELRLYSGGFHVFVGAPWVPEARRALRHAAGVLRGA